MTISRKRKFSKKKYSLKTQFNANPITQEKNTNSRERQFLKNRIRIQGCGFNVKKKSILGIFVILVRKCRRNRLYGVWSMDMSENNWVKNSVYSYNLFSFDREQNLQKIIGSRNFVFVELSWNPKNVHPLDCIFQLCTTNTANLFMIRGFSSRTANFSLYLPEKKTIILNVLFDYARIPLKCRFR